MRRRKLTSVPSESRTRQREKAQTDSGVGTGQRIAAPGTPRRPTITRGDVLVFVALLALCVVVYWPVYQFEFVHYDDGEYVSENVRVQAGLTAQNISWAFRTFFFDNWHPLTLAVLHVRLPVVWTEAGCISTGQPVLPLSELAAAYAEAGQSPKAIEAAQKSVDLAIASGQRIWRRATKSCWGFIARANPTG